MTGLGFYNAVIARKRGRAEFGSQIAVLSRDSADLARHVAEMGRRVAAAEARIESVSDKTSAGPDPLAAEIDELGRLVQQLAETVASHDVAIRRGGAALTAAIHSPPVAAPATVAPAPAEPVPVTAKASIEDDSDSGDVAENPAMAKTVREAVEAGRIDLYLQPIVTLPQRKVRYYESLSRMRAENGDMVVAANFLRYAEAAGVMARIDNLALFRSVQVVRRLMLKNRDISMFCNLAGSTLADEDFFPQLVEFVDANQALASSLVFEFSQRAVRGFGPVELKSLAALAQRGFRFSMDQVTDLRLEPRELSERGFRFVKVSAALLLNQGAANGTDIHPADLSDLMTRHGIELIASMIESEGIVVDLLDFKVRYG